MAKNFLFALHNSFAPQREPNKRSRVRFGFTALTHCPGRAKQLQTLMVGMVKGGIVGGRALCPAAETLTARHRSAAAATMQALFWATASRSADEPAGASVRQRFVEAPH